jgi:hypothetical protein
LKTGSKFEALEMLNLRGMDVRRKKLAKVFANEYYENYYPLILGGGQHWGCRCLDP